MQQIKKHDYEKKTYLKPTWCDVCECLLTGVINQGFACKACNKNICKTCRGSSNSNVWYGCGPAAQPEPVVPAQMNQTVMNFYLNYTSRSKDGQLIVHSLPKEWVELFKAAKVRPKELKNPDTVVFLLQLMEEHLAKMEKEGGKEEDVGSSAPAPTSDSHSEAEKGKSEAAAEAPAVLFRASAFADYQAVNADDLNLINGMTFWRT